MGIISELMASIDSMLHSLYVSPNFVCALILFVIAYGLSFILSAIPAALLALVDISARYMHARKDTWLSPDAFSLVLNVLFAVMLAPVLVAGVHAMIAGHVIGAVVVGLDVAAALYHGVFVGRSIAYYRRLPRLWDLFDEVLLD